MKKKSTLLIVSFFFLSFLLSTVYLVLPNYFQVVDSKIRDIYINIRGPEKTSDTIVIVDIDEKSLKALGQWPWERDKVARILQNLDAAKAGIIGLDILFSEHDRTSPKYFAQKWKLKVPSLVDYDAILANTIRNTPTIVGYVFDFLNQNENEAPQMQGVFIQKKKKGREYLPVAKGIHANIPILQNAAYSSGHLNNIPDEDGRVRSIPLLIAYNMQMYPSLAFEMYRIAKGIDTVIVNYSEAGITNIQLGNQVIPCDRFGKLDLNFRGPFKSYKYISAVDVYNNSFDKNAVKEKFVLIGTSAFGLMDIKSTPMDSAMPGVELHANAIDNLLINDMFYKPWWTEFVDLLSIIIIVFIIIIVLSRLSYLPLIIVYLVLFSALLFFYYWLLFDVHIMINLVFPILSMILAFVSVLGINYIFESKLKENIKKSFSKKVSKQVMDDLLLNPNSTDFSAKELNVTIYFSDIRSFTKISETLKSPKRITDFLNFYMDEMVMPIEESSGTIDKFIGDAIMAYWNAPIAVEHHADKAVQTALKQIKKRDILNLTIKEKFGFEVDYGIGINTGNAVVGEIGSLGRSDYTIIGDSVNLASRLEGLCKPYKVRLVISEFTKVLLKEEYIMQLLDRVRVKGKREPVKIYEVLGRGKPDENKLIELNLYENAYNLYRNSQFLDAGEAFKKLFVKYNKYLYDMYDKRCQDLLQEKIENFDGVFAFTTK